MAFHGFEIDGDLDDDPESGVDWQTPGLTITSLPDPLVGKKDSVFITGSKDLEQSGWECGVGSSPGKDDIVSAAVHFREDAGRQFLVANFVRSTSSGDAHISYVFSQGNEPASAKCPELPKRMTGDVRVSFDTDTGGKIIDASAQIWNDATNSWGPNLASGFAGEVNIPNTVPHKANGFVKGTFGEASLDLTQAVGGFACNEFSSIYAMSRAATVDNASLKDRTPTQSFTLGSCPKSSLAKAVRNVTKGGTFAGDPTSTTAAPGDVIEYRLTYKNSGAGVAHNVAITDPVPDRSTFLSCSDSCTQPVPPDDPSGTITWNLGDISAGATKAVTFRVTLDPSFPQGTTDITNTGTYDNDEEAPGTSNEATVVVSAAPRFTVTKTANPTKSFVGGTSSITITVTNVGDAPGTTTSIVDDYDQAHATPSAISDAGVDDGSEITWAAITLAADASKTFTYTVTFKGPFTGSPGGGGCDASNNEFPVDNTVSVSGASDSAQVCVNAEPGLTLNKEPDVTQAGQGDFVTYTLTYANTGNAPATGVVVSDDIPSGTDFESCTGGCTTNGPPITAVTWTIGTVEARAGGSVTLTVKVRDDVGCQICNSASISSNQTAPFTVGPICIDGIPGPQPDLANASGDAYGARVQDLNTGTVLPPINETRGGPISSSQSGVGSNSAAPYEVLNVSVPPATGDTLKASVVRGSSGSTVSNVTDSSAATSIAEAADVNVLNGVVKASLVRSVAMTTAGGSASSFSYAGSVIEGLWVDSDGSGPGQPQFINAVKPGDEFDLSAAFGPGSFVRVFEVTGATALIPGPTPLEGGTYTADLTVNMIRVHLTDKLPGPLFPGNQTVDVVVSHAGAHSDFPQITLCHAVPQQSVSGHAFIASETTTPPLLPAVAGFVSIPASGGSAEKSLVLAQLPADGSTVRAENTLSKSEGTLGASSSTATSSASAQTLCIEVGAVAGCDISATTVKSVASSTAPSGGGANSNDGGTTFVDLVVAGVPIGTTPAANTKVIELPGIGFVVINEQFCDGASGGPPFPVPGPVTPCTGAGGTSTGLTVRAIHVFVTVAGGPLPIGTEIIVAEAHSDATYVP